MMKNSLDLKIDYPSNIAAALLNDQIDIGLVPVAIIPEMPGYEIVSDYCISSDGEVGSVCLFSEVPVTSIKKVLLDYQSRTSVELVQLLLKEYWKISPAFEKAETDFRDKITGDVAAVVIGDRAFEQKKISTFSYDLGLAWKNLTSLPFVFAAWISNKPIDEGFVENFNKANEFGLNHINEVVAENPYALFDLKAYYTDFIQYRLNAASRQGMKQFLKRIQQNSGAEIPFYK
jgi:chorismate dehydratase